MKLPLINGERKCRSVPRHSLRLLMCYDNTQRLTIAILLFLLGCASETVVSDHPDLTPSVHQGSVLRQSPPSPPKPSQVDWWAVDKAVTEQLLSENLNTLANSLSKQPPSSDLAVLMHRFNVFVRAVQREQATATVDRLASVSHLIDKGQFSHMADFLIEREDWELTRRFLERIPQAEPGWGYIFIKHWAGQSDPQEIDQWLAVRAEANFEYWFHERLRFRQALGTEGELLNALETDVRTHPTDIAKAMRYLDAVSEVDKKPSVEWMGSFCLPELTYESYKIGQKLSIFSPRAAIALLERSLATPFTQQDQARIDQDIVSRLAVVSGPTDWEHQLRIWTKQALAQGYLADGQVDKAQVLLEELASLYPGGLPGPGLGQLAGQIQAGSGARVIEDRIRSIETANTNSPEYWTQRAEYYAGRREDTEARAAYEKAIALTPLNPANIEQTSFARLLALGNYASYLFRREGERAAFEVFSRELNSAQPGTDYAQRLINEMWEYDRGTTPLLLPTDERLWVHLSVRTKWGYPEEHVLFRIMERVPENEREQYWRRTEALVQDADPTRKKIVGWIMTRMNAIARGLPLLKGAMAEFPDGEAKDFATYDVFEAYVNLGDWKAAETVWPLVRVRMQPREITEWLGRLSVTAAKDGALDDALRFWRAKANLDSSDLRLLDELAQLGMQERLRALYQQMQRDNPSSAAPTAALKVLQ